MNQFDYSSLCNIFEGNISLVFQNMKPQNLMKELGPENFTKAEQCKIHYIKFRSNWISSGLFWIFVDINEKFIGIKQFKMSKDATGIRSQQTKIEMLERETFLLKLQLSYYQDARRIDVPTKCVMEMQVGVFSFVQHSKICIVHFVYIIDSKWYTKKWHSC